MGKKVIVLIVVGLLVMVIGVGGGIMVGKKFFGSSAQAEKEVLPPGPMMPLGDFTVNLADVAPHVARFKITVELSSEKVPQKISVPGWDSRIKNEIIMTVKDCRYNDLKSAEGMQTLAQNIRGRLNAILPKTDGQVAINRVLFEEFIVQ